MGFTLRRLMAGRLVGMAVEGVGTWLLLLVGGVPMAALLGILDRPARLHPQYRRDHLGRADRAGRLLRRRRRRALGDRRLFHRPDRRRLSDRPLRRHEDRRPGARAGARRAAPVRRAVRAHGPGARRSDRGDDQGRARAEIERRRGRGRSRSAAKPEAGEAASGWLLPRAAGRGAGPVAAPALAPAGRAARRRAAPLGGRAGARRRRPAARLAAHHLLELPHLLHLLHRRPCRA